MIEAPLLLPYGFAVRTGIIARRTAGQTILFIRRTAELSALPEARRKSGAVADIRRVDDKEFDQLLAETYSDIDAALSEESASSESESLSAVAGAIAPAADLLDGRDEAPVIRLINALIAEGVQSGASDIHIEPFEAALIVRMRTDGVLRERLRLPQRIAPVIASRIKVMSRLDISERRLPQDGRISLAFGTRAIDVRVSTLPSRAGERVVLRLLDRNNSGLSLDQLGMPVQTASAFRSALSEPNGVVLVTGPTGSGKTTTLYAGLRRLNDGARSILTVEDPVEYGVEGVGQTQVNPKAGLTFAAGLRAILRQDPDCVMVGEIRDAETAQIAIQASLTGHLVLSTVHTNDAIGAVVRLRDMGVEPFLLGSTLRVCLAQRLVRRLCTECRRPVNLDPSTAAATGMDRDEAVYSPGGCPLCRNTGYSGRMALFEHVRIDETISRLISAGAPEEELAEAAYMPRGRLADSARIAVREGDTSMAEALRVIRRREGADGDL